MRRVPGAASSRLIRALTLLVIGASLPGGAAEVVSTPITAKERLPKGVEPVGAFLTGVQWLQTDGQHLVVLSTVGPQRQRSADGERSAELHGAHWRKGQGAWKVLWRMTDRVDRCPLELTCAFVPGSLELTDLDGNGVAEVSLLYRLGCQGGVDPATQKLLLYEGTRKFALRGLEKLVTPEGVSGGDFTVDPAFVQAPAFLVYAREKWARLGGRIVQ